MPFSAVLPLDATAVAFDTTSSADLTPRTDDDVSNAVWAGTTVEAGAAIVDANLEGPRNAWLPSTALQRKLRYVGDSQLFRSHRPMSGEFKLLLLVKFKSTADTAPNKARYEAFAKGEGESGDECARDPS